MFRHPSKLTQAVQTGRIAIYVLVAPDWVLAGKRSPQVGRLDAQLKDAGVKEGSCARDWQSRSDSQGRSLSLRSRGHLGVRQPPPPVPNGRCINTILRVPASNQAIR